jgi:carbon storage regulator
MPEQECGHLVLTRHVGGTIRIGKDIAVTFLGFTNSGEVKLGFEAPKSVPIHRKEAREKKP